MLGSLFTPNGLMNLLLSLPGIIIAITFHEIAHGLAAEAMGDNTARMAGRLSLNPLAHLDPIGFLSMVLFRFGWAKPVPVNTRNFRERRKGIILVSLAGSLTNLLLGFIALLTIFILAKLNLNNYYLNQILQYMYIYNLMFAIFNLIPIPPLDGSQILAEFLPYKALQVYERITRQYGFIILILLIFSGVIGMIINPLMGVINTLFTAILSFVFGLF